MIEYGAKHYQQRSEETGALLKKILTGYRQEGVVMAQTFAEFIREAKAEQRKELLEEITAAECRQVLAKLPARERRAVLKEMPVEEIEGCLKAMKKRAVPKKLPKHK